MTRKPTEGYAKLAVPPALLKSLIASATFQDRPLSVRTLSAKCGHKSHQHLLRLANGQTSTTSEHTADIVEQFLQKPGLLFTRHPARTVDQFHSTSNGTVATARRAA